MVEAMTARIIGDLRLLGLLDQLAQPIELVARELALLVVEQGHR
jgi:hypothetical protein